MDFTHDAEKFVRQLRGIEDDSSRTQQRLKLIADTESFVAAWRTLARVHVNAPAQQPAFERILHNFTNENKQMVADLGRKLADATLTNKKEGKRTLLFFKGTSGILKTFFGFGQTRLRHSQILYATAVVNLITYIIIHVKNHGYADSDDEEWDLIRRDQLETIQKQQQAMKDLRSPEQHVRDHLVYPRRWLGEFEWIDDPGHLPFEIAASMWFDDTSSDSSNVRPSGGSQGLSWEHQMQTLQQDFRRYQEKADERLENLEHQWNMRFEHQQTAWQSLIDELNTQKANLEQELEEVKQEREKLKQEMERLKSGVKGIEPKTFDVEQIDAEIDEHVLTIEVKRDLVDAERRGLDEERLVSEGKRRASNVENIVSSRSSQRTFEASNRSTNTPSAVDTARGRTTLPINELTGPPNRNRYPPQAPVKLTRGKRRDSTPDTRPRSSSRDSHSSSINTDTTLVNSISASSLQDSRNLGNLRLKSSSRTASHEIGVIIRNPGTSDSSLEGQRDSQQQGYEYSRRKRKPSRDRSSSSTREYEDPYRTPPLQHYGTSNSAEHNNPYPQVDLISKHYDSQSSSDVPRYLPQTTERREIRSQRKNSYQESTSLNLGRIRF